MSRLVNCDFCYVRIRIEEAWSYIWPPTHIPEKFGTKAMDDDGEWCSCYDCHQILQRRDMDALIKRSIAGDIVAQHVPEAVKWKRYIFEWLLEMPLLEEPYQGPPRERPFDGQHR